MGAPTENTGKVAAENIGKVAMPEDDAVAEPIHEIASNVSIHQCKNTTHAKNNTCKHAYPYISLSSTTNTDIAHQHNIT